MLNRRHFRVKVLQTIYAMHQHESDQLDKEERFLFQSIDQALDLYLLILSIFTQLKKIETDYLDAASKKHLATKEDKNPNKKFINNTFFKFLEENNRFNDLVEARKVNNWKLNDDTVIAIWEEVKKSELYQKYMANPEQTYKKEIFFALDIFTEIIAPNDTLYNYLEDYKITWIDDIPVVNTLISKQIRALLNDENSFVLPKVFKDEEDQQFIKDLFRKTVLNEIEFSKYYEEKTPNWDKDRIAEIDTIILKMAICELLKFPSIPIKVTLNEYLEIAKEYSTPKSSIFINGVLDNLVKQFKDEDKIKKTGRGLL